MKYLRENDSQVFAQCVKCNRELIIEKSRCQSVDNGYNISSPISCACGENSRYIRGLNSVNDEIKCPKCNSTQLTANKKGFGLGKAVAGGVLLGGIGLLGGFIGSGKIEITCLKCGYQWKP